jgi:hypothetical protein
MFWCVSGSRAETVALGSAREESVVEIFIAIPMDTIAKTFFDIMRDSFPPCECHCLKPGLRMSSSLTLSRASSIWPGMSRFFDKVHYKARDEGSKIAVENFSKVDPLSPP